MKIIIEPGDMEEPEVIIRGRSGSEEVRQLLELLGGAGGISQIPLYLSLIHISPTANSRDFC